VRPAPAPCARALAMHEQNRYITYMDNLARKITKEEILGGRWTYNDYKNWD
jgi:hypothetical protein